MRFSAVLIVLLSTCWLAGRTAADETSPPPVRLTPETVARFAATGEGQQILTADDAFTASLSRFDLQCRLKTDREVTLADWRAFVGQQVRPWNEADTKLVRESLERLAERLKTFRLPLPPVVQFVRTTGEEEGNAAYTRGTAVVLPTKVIRYSSEQMDRLLAHELFHVLSRHDGAVRSRLYGIIGFELCEPITLPPSFAPRRIANPDAPLINCITTLTAANGKTVTAAPVLYSSTARYDAKSGKSLFQSLLFRLLLVEERGGRYEPVLTRGQPVVLDPKKEPAFLEKIGQNTNYIIHPDEILADNFVHLVMGDRNLPTPRILDEIRRILSKHMR
jgi:hypothetical protein